MSAPTIPADHLNAIGMDGSDPPVRFTDAKGRQWSWHPDDCDCNEGDLDFGDQFGDRLEDGAGVLLAVEHSMPALLRALARQYGAKLEPGEVPTWGRDEHGIWCLAVPGMFETFSPPVKAHLGGTHRPVPALTEDLGRLEALAAVIAWQVSR